MNKKLKRFLIALIVFIIIAAAFVLEFALLDITAVWVTMLIVITGVMLIVSSGWVFVRLIQMGVED